MDQICLAVPVLPGKNADARDCTREAERARKLERPARRAANWNRQGGMASRPRSHWGSVDVSRVRYRHGRFRVSDRYRAPVPGQLRRHIQHPFPASEAGAS